MASPALAFLAGLGGGYVTQQQRNIENERADRADQRQQDIHDLQMKNAQRDADLQVALANAARPAQVDQGAGGLTKPDTADNIDVGQPGDVGGEDGPALQQGTLVNGKAYGNSGEAANAAASFNDPNAVTLRQVQALNQAGKPADALNLQKSAFTLSKEQAEYANKLKEEGAFETAKALRQGDPQAIKEAFNKGGKWKIVGEPVVVPTKRTDIPGLPEVTTYDATVTLEGPDGKQITKTVNSHDFSMSVLPFEKGLELTMKGQHNEDTADYREQLADVKGKLADVAGKVADQKVKDAQNRSNTTLTEAERKKWTATMNAASSNLRTAEKALGDFQKDKLNQRSLAKNPAGPEAQQLKQLQDAVAKHTADYNEARGKLAAAPSGAAPITAPTGKVMPLPANKGELKTGQQYQTARGVATWNGSAFEQ